MLALAAPLLALMGTALSDEPGYNTGLFRGLRPRHTAPVQWYSLAEGFDRAVLKFEGETLTEPPKPKLVPRRIELVVFRINTGRYPVKVVTANGVLGQKKATLPEIHKRVGAVLTVNGGFFSKEGDPMGMVISDGKRLGEYNMEDGSGAIAVYGGVVRIGWASPIAVADPPPDQALQNGPLLVEPLHVFGIVHIREKFFSRTIAALDNEGRLLIGVTRKIYGDKDQLSGLNLYEAAKIFYHPQDMGGLGASVALNLDGGTSTGMEFSLGSNKDRVRVGIALPNFVCVMPPK